MFHTSPKRLVLFPVLLAALLIVALALPLTHFTEAQDTGTGTICDSTLILLVFIAENEYGFSPSLDMTTFDTGQFGTLYDDMMMNDMMEMTPEATVDPMMGAQPDATMEATMETDMGMDPSRTFLLPGNVAGEDPNCTALRAEVESFLFDRLNQDMMSESGAAG